MSDSTHFASTVSLTPLSGYLFTPPEKMADSFSQKDVGSATATAWHPKLAPIHSGAPSPPITPETRLMASFDTAQHDRPLFSTRDAHDSPHADTPLFEIERHRPTSPVQTELSRPSTASDGGYSPKSNLGRVIGPGVYIENSVAGVKEYYLARMAEFSRYRKPLPTPTASTAILRDPYTTRQVQALGKPIGIVKPKHNSVKLSAKAKISKPSTVVVKATTPAKRTPKHVALDDFADHAFSSNQATKHKRAAPSKKVEGKEEDKKWRDIPDYAPPVRSLDSAPKPLKADWKAEPKDISHEPDAEALAPAEYALASGLRLLPQQYLANKRRMFQARLQHLKDGKNFTKTAAQLACNIDVNKASSLWEAFNRVGWFRESWFEQFL